MVFIDSCMNKQVDPQIIHNAIINYIDKTRLLYPDKIPFTFFYNRELTEEQKLAMAWRQGMIDILNLIEREFIYPRNDSALGSKPVGSGHWTLAVPESLKEAAEKIVCPHPIEVVGELVPNIKLEDDELFIDQDVFDSIPDDDWSYDEMRDNELQDRLAAEKPNNNPVY